MVRKNGKVISESVTKNIIAHQLVYVHYKVRDDDQHVLKKVVKGEEVLKLSRVLKYYTYSKQSKYHSYCDHRRGECKIGF